MELEGAPARSVYPGKGFSRVPVDQKERKYFGCQRSVISGLFKMTAKGAEE